MTDIVERLLHPGHGPLADEAAHEIERLRGENLALTNEVDVLRFAGEVQGERLSAEIGQLEGLLRKIDGILKSGLSASHQRLQIALLIEGAAIAGAADQPSAAPVCPQCGKVMQETRGGPGMWECLHLGCAPGAGT